MACGDRLIFFSFFIFFIIFICCVLLLLFTYECILVYFFIFSLLFFWNTHLVCGTRFFSPFPVGEAGSEGIQGWDWLQRISIDAKFSLLKRVSVALKILFHRIFGCISKRRLFRREYTVELSLSLSQFPFHTVLLPVSVSVWEPPWSCTYLMPVSLPPCLFTSLAHACK